MSVIFLVIFILALSWYIKRKLDKITSDRMDNYQSLRFQIEFYLNPEHAERRSLMHAARNGNSEVIKTLLAAGADANWRDFDNWTALIYASYHCHAEVVKLLIDAKADLDYKDETGNTALHYAFSSNFWELSYADDKLDDLRRQHTEVVKLLIDANANVYAMNNKGETLLHKAILTKNTEVVKLLLAAKKPKYFVSKNAQNFATQMGHHEIAALIKLAR